MKEADDRLALAVCILVRIKWCTAYSVYKSNQIFQQISTFWRNLK